jgi:hypothetical protein
MQRDPTLRGVPRHDVVAWLDGSDALANRLNDGPSLVAQDAREQPFWVRPSQRVDVRVAQRVGHNLHTHFPGLWRSNDDVALLKVVHPEPVGV